MRNSISRTISHLTATLLALLAIAFAAPALAQTVKIVTFGDSGPAGNGVTQSQGYPAQLQAMLRAKGVNATVQNISVSGDTTAMGLARIGLVPKDAAVVITEFGSNDLRGGVSTAQMNASMEMIAKRLRSNGAQVLMMGTRGIKYFAVAERTGSHAITYPMEFKAYIQRDTGKHLTPEGHRKAAAMILPKVMELIEASQKKS
jgi:acyl-CoA thioesterase I